MANGLFADGTYVIVLDEYAAAPRYAEKFPISRPHPDYPADGRPPLRLTVEQAERKKAHGWGPIPLSRNGAVATEIGTIVLTGPDGVQRPGKIYWLKFRQRS